LYTPASKPSFVCTRVRGANETLTRIIACGAEKLPNPMVPRHGVDPQLFPKGVTLEMERHWMAQIEAIRARQQKQ